MAKVPSAYVVLLAFAFGCSGGATTPSNKPDAATNERDSGGVDSATGHDPSTSDGESFLMEYAAAVCAMYEPCCESAALGYDAAGCTTWFRKVTAAYFRGEFRADAAAECLRDLANARDADAARCSNVASFDEATLRDSCRQAFGAVYSGGAALGGKCLLAGDCNSDPSGEVICYGSRCIVDRRGKDGDGLCYLSGRSSDEPLPTEIVRCETSDGLYCHRGERVCKKLGAIGEACPYVNACVEGATCAGGRCAALPGPGESCLNAVPGAGGTCGPGSNCDKVTLLCGPALDEAASCREPSQCASRVCTSGKCAKAEFTRALNCTGK